jgi:hypothetical protein
MTPVERFAACRALCLSAPPHTPESLRAYRALIVREYARAEARRQPHPQQPLPGVG